MSSPETKPLSIAMIPWVVALVALVGLGAIAPGGRLSKRQESLHESGLCELSGDFQLRGRFVDPLVFISPGLWQELPPIASFTVIPRVDAPPAEHRAAAPAGSVRGRAPPVGEIDA